MTFLQIINLIKDTALAQPNVNTFVRNFLDLNREDTVYSAVVLQDRDGNRDRISEQDWNTYTFHLGYVDRLTYDESNRDDIFSTGINIINNIVASIRDTWFPDVEVNIIDRFQTFDQRFTASCAGVYVVLSIQVPISDCVDGEQTDIYDKYETKITKNGHYHFVPDGRPIDEIDITIDVPGGGQKPEESLVETISSNGDYHYDPSAGSVFSDVSIAVDVHPSVSLSETYTSNGTYNVSGEFKDGVVTVSVPSDMKPETICDKIIEENGSFHYYPESGEVFNDVHITTNVHPSVSLSETYTENGIYNISGEFNGGSVTVSVSGGGQKPEERLIQAISANGSYHYDPSAGSVFSVADITVSVPVPNVYPASRVSISDNGTYGWTASEGDAWNEFSVDVDVHPSVSLSRTYTENGTKTITGEFNGGTINVNVHPSASLSETYTSNGTYNISGEFNGGVVTVAVSAAKPEESLVETISSNGSYHYDPSAGSVFSGVDITVSCPEPKPEIVGSLTVSENGTGTLYPGIGGVFNMVNYNVEVHPSMSLVETISSNGTTSFSGEWKDASITVDVHPSSVLSETYTTNGTKTITGEFNGGSVVVDVHPSTSLTETIISNGSYSYPGEYAGAEITVAVPTYANTLRISQTAYNNLSVKDPDTIYLIYY